jgi:hypothetical protein
MNLTTRLLVSFFLVAVAATPSFAVRGDCGQPATNGEKPLASDALFILRGSVQLVDCGICVCDIDGNDKVLAGDALGVLQASVDLPAELNPNIAKEEKSGRGVKQSSDVVEDASPKSGRAFFGTTTFRIYDTRDRPPLLGPLLAIASYCVRRAAFPAECPSRCRRLSRMNATPKSSSAWYWLCARQRSAMFSSSCRPPCP